MSQPEHRDTPKGFVYAGGAYFIWGFLPLYMKLLAHLPALEILPHRILWSVPLTAIAIWWNRLWPEVADAFNSPRKLATALLVSVLISINWGTYVWAVVTGHVLQTALGYYINPLFSVLLAWALIGEKLNKPKIVAIILAAAAVAFLTWEEGGVPWVSVILFVTWGFYAYFKRMQPIAPIPGFFLEVLMLAIPSIAAIAWLEAHGESHFMRSTTSDTLLLLGTGFFTAIPLVFYAIGAKLLRLSTIALMQYSAPTVAFLVAVFVFHEPFSAAKFAAFVMIWTALAIYTWALVRK